jgi:hypothetical protein
MPPSLDPDIAKLLKKGQKIEALKRLRARTNLGLSEAKALIDAFQQYTGDAPAPPPVPMAGSNRTHAQQHDFAAVPEQSVAQMHSLGQRSGLGPGEVPAPQYQIVKVAAFLMLLAGALWYLLQGG